MSSVSSRCRWGTLGGLGWMCWLAVPAAWGQVGGRVGTGGAGLSSGMGLLGGASLGGGLGGAGLLGGGGALGGGAGLLGAGLGLTGGALTGGGTFTGSSTPGGTRLGGLGYGAAGFGMTGATGNVFPQVPSPLNPFQNAYANPLALGSTLNTLGKSSDPLGSTTPTAFGQPSRTTQTTTVTTTTRPAVGSSNSYTSGGFTTLGQVRTPSFVTTLASDLSLRSTPPASKWLSEIRQTIAQSRQLSAPEKVQVQLAADGETLILRGSVRDLRERRLVENLVRLTPGVHEVINQLQVASPPAR
jgi:hypothetical protein